MSAVDQQEILHESVQQAARLGGILGAAARYHLARPGKQLRGGLAQAVASRLGVDTPSARDLGVACELLHNASLVHDDIQDRDVLRRGRETVWVRFGEPVAINLGDHLLACAFACLAKLPAPAERRIRLVQVFAVATSRIACGQSDEILHREDLSLERDRYERIARDKTGPLLALPLACAAILAGLEERDVAAMREGGLLLGTAYQLADDVADLLDQKQRGEAGADLREGKLTWPAIDFLEHTTQPSKEHLLQLLSARERRTADVMPWVRAIRDSGAIERTMTRIDELLTAARSCWTVLPADCVGLLHDEVLRFERSLPACTNKGDDSDTSFEVAE